MERLRRENEQLSKKLSQAELIIDIQKKVAAILGNQIETPQNNEDISCEMIEQYRRQTFSMSLCELEIPRASFYRQQTRNTDVALAVPRQDGQGMRCQRLNSKTCWICCMPHGLLIWPRHKRMPSSLKGNTYVRYERCIAS